LYSAHSSAVCPPPAWLLEEELEEDDFDEELEEAELELELDELA